MSKAPATNDNAPPAATDKAARVRGVVDEYLQQRASGMTVSGKALLESHPELLPELQDELRKLAVIDQALAQPAADPSADVESSTLALATALYIRCPHCREAFEGNPEATVEELRCSHCGKAFSLVNRKREARLQRIGRFELIEQLGMGSFGTVWRARDAQLERDVAVKVPRRKQLDPLEIEEVMREARVVAQLNHPHIVRVHEVGVEDDSVFIVSNLIRGLPLHEAKEKRPLTFEQMARLCQKITGALEHAHKSGVIHRDLKPANIMIDENGQPHLTDFGLAKNTADEISMTLEGRILGTPAYMSPEQARGDASHCDRRSDIYSLGVVLYELLTDEIPFRGNMRRIVQQVLEDDPPPPRKLNNYVPRDLETICLKCMEKDPQKRYQTAERLGAELNRFLAGEPILARPVSAVEKCWRSCRRYPGTALFVAAAIAMLVLSAGVTVLAARGLEHRLAEQIQRANMDAAESAARETTNWFIKLADPIVRGAASDELIAGLADIERNQGPADQRTKAKVQALYDRYDELLKLSKAKSVALFDHRGNMVEIAGPDDGNFDIVGKAYIGRDYFQGAKDHADHGRIGMDAVHISRVFKSEFDPNYKYEMSVPVVSDGEFMGVLAVSVATDDMDKILPPNDTQEVLLVGPGDQSPPRPDAEASYAKPPEHVVIYHPAYREDDKPKALSKKLWQTSQLPGRELVAHAALPLVQQAALAALLRGEVAQAAAEAAGEGTTKKDVERWRLEDFEFQVAMNREVAPASVPDYVDPCTGDRSIPGWARVGNTEWMIIVQRPYDKAIGEPVWLAKNFVFWGWAALGLAALLAGGVMWSRASRR